MNWLLIIGITLTSLGALYFLSTRSPIVQSTFLSQKHLEEIFLVIQNLRQTTSTEQIPPHKTSQGMFISYMRNYVPDNSFFIHNILFGVDTKTNPKDWNTLVHQHISSFVQNAYKLDTLPKTHITDTGVLFVTILFRVETENMDFIQKSIEEPEDYFVLTRSYTDIKVENYTQAPTTITSTDTSETDTNKRDNTEQS